MLESTTLLILNNRDQIHSDLDNIKVKIDGEGKNLLLLTSLPMSFEHFKNVFIYSKDSTINLY